MQAFARGATARMLRRNRKVVAMHPKSMKAYLAIATISLSLAPAVPAQPSGEAGAAMRAGAARIDHTPRGPELPGNFTGVLDPIFVRTLVLDNGSTRAALVAVDAGAIPSDLYDKVSARAAAELEIPASQLLISASHTHSVPFRLDARGEETIVRGLRDSIARLQPARVAWGTGVSYINVNRDRIDPKTQRWWEGPNYDGPSDKTVAVVRVETPGGAPIAVYYNYAVHGVITGTLDLISGDIPGAASRYVEESLGGGAVALFASGAAGDQNPIYFNQTYELREIRRTTQNAAKTSATPCRRAVRDWTATLRASSSSWTSKSA
jgi:hypothetical protein